MVDQLDNLLRFNPAVRMKDEIENSLFQHRDIECCLHVLDGFRIVRLLQKLSFPIARHHAGKFPAQLIDHVGVRIILNPVDKVVLRDAVSLHAFRDVLTKLFSAVGVGQQFFGNLRIRRRVHAENR